MLISLEKTAFFTFTSLIFNYLWLFVIFMMILLHQFYIIISSYKKVGSYQSDFVCLRLLSFRPSGMVISGWFFLSPSWMEGGNLRRHSDNQVSPSIICRWVGSEKLPLMLESPIIFILFGWASTVVGLHVDQKEGSTTS